MKLDPQDRAAFSKLDNDFIVASDGESAKIVGEITVKMIRTTNDRLQLTLEFPGGEELIVRLARAQLLDQFDIETDEG
jgi:hypothetical protein